MGCKQQLQMKTASAVAVRTTLGNERRQKRNLHDSRERHIMVQPQFLSSARSSCPRLTGHFHLDIPLGMSKMKFITCTPQSSNCCYLSFLSGRLYHFLSQSGWHLSPDSFPPLFLIFDLLSVLWFYTCSMPTSVLSFPFQVLQTSHLVSPSSFSHCQSSSNPHILPCLRTFATSFQHRWYS